MVYADADDPSPFHKVRKPSSGLESVASVLIEWFHELDRQKASGIIGVETDGSDDGGFPATP